MKLMTTLSQQQQPSNVAVYPQRVIQLISAPYFGSINFPAGSAQFGLDLSNNNQRGVLGRLGRAYPEDACRPLENDVKGKLVMVRRGNCQFMEKGETLQAAGAAGAIIIGLSVKKILCQTVHAPSVSCRFSS